MGIGNRLSTMCKRLNVPLEVDYIYRHCVRVDTDIFQMKGHTDQWIFRLASVGSLPPRTSPIGESENGVESAKPPVTKLKRR